MIRAADNLTQKRQNTDVIEQAGPEMPGFVVDFAESRDADL
jgi:hypothetical protein